MKASLLSSLTDDQKEQLAAWLEAIPRTEVIEKLARPAPEGFGLRVHATQLARFQEKYNRDQRAALLRDRSIGDAGDRQFLLAAGEGQLLQHVLTLLRTSHPAGPLVSAAAKILAAQQNQAHRCRELDLRERELKLREARFELERQIAAADLVLREAGSPNDCASDHIQAAVVQILTPRPFSSPPQSQPGPTSGGTPGHQVETPSEIPGNKMNNPPA